MDIKDRPIIKSFICDGNYYIYDAFKNLIFNVSKKHYLEVMHLCKVGIREYRNIEDAEPEHKDIIAMLNQGFFSSTFIKRVRHPETGIVGHLIRRCISDITLQVTKQCNFKCRYCSFANYNHIGRNHENKEMSFEIAKQAIDFLFDHSKDAETISIAFYGGEPLLNYPLIMKVVEYANSIFFTKKIKYLMTTNGSILSDEIMDLLIQNNFELTISFDGPETIQNKHRKFLSSGGDTFNTVLENIEKIRKKDLDYFNHNVVLLPVCFEDEDDQEIGLFFNSLNIQDDKLHKVIADLKGIDYNLNRRTLRSINDLANIESNKNMELKYMNIYLDKRPIEKIWHHNGPCVPTMQRLFVGINGKLYICEKSLEEEFVSIGDIYKGIDKKRVIDFMNIGKLTEDDCKNCWAMRFCNICLMYCIDIERKEVSSEKKRVACKEIRNDVLSFFKRKIIKK